VIQTASTAESTDWICAGHACWRGGAPVAAASSTVLGALNGISERVGTQQWVRYRIDLDRVPPAPGDVRLTPLDDALVGRLRSHPDHAQEEFASGVAFWDMGIRGGLVWLEEGEPLCFQWLLGNSDVAALRARSEWGFMYPPLESGTAQLEKLWTFSTARKKGIASRYALAMYAEASAAGYRSLITHIHETNDAARSWAQRTGWREYGRIVRYLFDVPVIRRFNLSVCAHKRRREADDAR
jgi:ribosomal protein S18 acetylase RimI-like enzyme